MIKSGEALAGVLVGDDDVGFSGVAADGQAPRKSATFTCQLLGVAFEHHAALLDNSGLGNRTNWQLCDHRGPEKPGSC